MALTGFERFCRWLGGIEQVNHSGLPVEEFAHPYPLGAMVLLGVNDHVLKGAGLLPGWLTGKLSDFAGLLFFPLFLTAAWDTLLYAAHRLTGGRSPDYSLSMPKLWVAALVTAIIFVPLKLSTAWGTLYIHVLERIDVLNLFGGFQVVTDPTDLLAVVMVPLAVWHGRRFVRRLPLGRLPVLAHASEGLDGTAQADALKAGTQDIRRLIAARPASAGAFDAFLAALPPALADGADDDARADAQRALDHYRRSLSERVP